MSRTMLIGAAHLPNVNKLLAEAINAPSYIRNRVFSSVCNASNMTPYESMMRRKPNIFHVEVFGSKAYVHTCKPNRKGQFGHRARLEYLVGFE